MVSRRLNRRPRTFLAHALLALCLLAAQGFAQAHVYSHLSSGTPTDLGSTAGKLCSECLSGASLLSAAGAPSPLQVSISPAIVSCDEQVVLFRVDVSRHYAFRSRAPPATF